MVGKAKLNHQVLLKLLLLGTELFLDRKIAEVGVRVSLIDSLFSLT